MNKRTLIVILIIVIAVAVIIGIVAIGNSKGKKEESKTTDEPVEEYVEKTADGTKVNTSNELKKEKTLGDLVFTNIQLTNKNGQTVLIANVTNKGSKTTDLKEVNIVILDKTGVQLGKVGGVIIPLQAGQSTQFSSSVQRDYANAYDFKVEEK